MGKNRRPEVTSENASEHPGSLGLVADGGVLRLDGGPPDGKR